MTASPADRRAQRLRGSVRLLRGPDDGAFDRVFWSEIPPAQRLELVWEMVLEFTALGRTDLATTKRAAGRPQDLLDLALLEKHQP